MLISVCNKCYLIHHLQQITALKKENFNLKLRIYFMEDRMQQKCDDSTEDIFKTVLYLIESISQMCVSPFVFSWYPGKACDLAFHS